MPANIKEDSDYILWKKSPGDFLDKHLSCFKNIINKNCFTGHFSSLQKKEWDEKIFLEMKLKKVRNELMKYQHKSTFLIFYINLLKNVVKKESQNEDEILLDVDFNTLIIKYRPLILQVVVKLVFFFGLTEDAKDDTIQQVSLNILSKKKKIRNSYDKKQLFRNYIWTIITNESKNYITKELKVRNRYEDKSDTEFLTEMFQNDGETKALINEVLQILDRKILSYLHFKAKLVVCLKVVFKSIVYEQDLLSLPNSDKFKTLSLKLFVTIVTSLAIIVKNEGILGQFVKVKPILNFSENSKTDENSYWRWTNKQVNDIIHYLNYNFMMSFNRETLTLLMDRYFEDFHTPNVQNSNQDLYIVKK